MTIRIFLLAFTLLGLALASGAAVAGTDSGFYVGGGIGRATVEDDVPDPDDEGDFGLDGDDNAWKVVAGYNFGLVPLVDLAVEGGYVNLGEADDDIGGTNVSIEIDGWDLFGLVGLNFGPFGVFAKAGVVSWDAEANFGGFSVDDDGTDPAYGAGARFQLGSFQIRGEFEQFDVSDVDDVYLLSVSALYTF